MNKNAIGLHKFSRIFRRGILQYFPHIPCRLQHERRILCRFRLFFASTRPVQIATYCPSKPCWDRESSLPPHAPCRLQLQMLCGLKITGIFASTRSVQIATCRLDEVESVSRLFASTRSVQIATLTIPILPNEEANFASTRSVQIATGKVCADSARYGSLPPHAPCRLQQAGSKFFSRKHSLPPHAPCRLQLENVPKLKWTALFASTRSVQIATAEMHRIAIYIFQNAC